MPPPTSGAIHDAVIEVLKDVSRRPIEPALDSDLIADLGFDSLQIMETVAALEDRFAVSVPQEQLQEARTVRAIVERVAAIAGAAAPP
jgi:acyl carrier protein